MGLLATASAGRWTVEVSEALGGGDYSLEIDGPQAYLLFNLSDLRVLKKAFRLLQGALHANGRQGEGLATSEDRLPLGHFGAASVTLVRDNEESPRCFVVVGPKARSTLRLTLQADDIRMVSAAIEEIVKDLPKDAMGKRDA